MTETAQPIHACASRRPTKRVVFDTLSAKFRRIAGFHLGRSDAVGGNKPAGGGKAIRPTVTLTCARGAWPRTCGDFNRRRGEFGARLSAAARRLHGLRSPRSQRLGFRTPRRRESVGMPTHDRTKDGCIVWRGMPGRTFGHRRHAGARLVSRGSIVGGGGGRPPSPIRAGRACDREPRSERGRRSAGPGGIDHHTDALMNGFLPAVEHVVLLDEHGGAVGVADKGHRPHLGHPLHLAFASYVFAPDMRDPDLIIRTGGERRLSGCPIVFCGSRRTRSCWSAMYCGRTSAAAVWRLRWRTTRGANAGWADGPLPRVECGREQMLRTEHYCY